LAHEDGEVVSLTHRPPLPPGNNLCVVIYIYAVIPQLTSDPANEFFG